MSEKTAAALHRPLSPRPAPTPAVSTPGQRNGAILFFQETPGSASDPHVLGLSSFQEVQWVKGDEMGKDPPGEPKINKENNSTEWHLDHVGPGTEEQVMEL